MPKKSMSDKYEEYRRNASKHKYVEVMTQEAYSSLEDRPLKAIRAFCNDCVGGNSHEIKKCCAYDCSLWPYRLGVGSRVAHKDRPELMSREYVRKVLNSK